MVPKGRVRATAPEELDPAAWLAAERKQSCSAAQLAGAATALVDALNPSLPPVHDACHVRAVHTMGAELGDQAFAVAWTEGQTLTLENAVARVLEEFSRP